MLSADNINIAPISIIVNKIVKGCYILENSKISKTAIIVFIVAYLIAAIFTIVYFGTGGNNTNTATNSVSINIPDSKNEKIDINTCSKEALKYLTGIDEVLATRIINGRPYKDIYELDKIKGIGRETIDILRDKVVCN